MGPLASFSRVEKGYVKDINDIEIQGVIPLELASSTTEQTSASQREGNCPCRPV